MPALGWALVWFVNQKLKQFLELLVPPSPLSNCTVWASHLALPSIHGSQIFLKLDSQVKIHNIVPQGGDCADDHVISRVDDLFIGLQETNEFSQNHIDIWRMRGRGDLWMTCIPPLTASPQILHL